MAGEVPEQIRAGAVDISRRVSPDARAMDRIASMHHPSHMTMRTP
jgi:hypothetical protein